VKGWQNIAMAAEVRLDRRQAALWRRYFLESGIAALRRDVARVGRTLSATPQKESRIVHSTLH